MVFLCENQYTLNDIEGFKEFGFELSDFQKYAINGIINDKNVLITAHTGSGKTLPAEFAIKYFTSKNKKVIYTSPIKALSNQKFYDFKEKFPGLSIGILTGDIKYNPDADVLIMTTEILRNTLLQNKISKKDKSYNNIIQFKMDIENDLGCVVFDEIHYINDQSRGGVWEETIIELPNHIQLLMLSATINHADEFAKWIEFVSKKEVFLVNTNHRVVPLIHYLYTYFPETIINKIKNDSVKSTFINNTNKLITIKDKTTNFNELVFQKQKKMNDDISKNYSINRHTVLNNLINMLKLKQMLPAICFVFSRKQLEICAKNIEFSLFSEDESSYPQIIRHECELILKKLPNFNEYINLPEFNMICKLLEKGVAIHHSGIMPIFREMIELVFAKGYIKILFATETFAVGINMPTKTVIFSNIEKFDGTTNRVLLPHEYTQMAGRAGRRGLDTIGHVIHCCNLIDMPSYSVYKNMLSGTSQTIISKYKISYNVVLNLIIKNIDKSEFINELEKSMLKNEIAKEIKSIKDEIYKNKEQLDGFNKKINFIKTPMEICKEYYDKITNVNMLSNKLKKKCLREISNIEEENKTIKLDIENYKNIKDKEKEIKTLEYQLKNTEDYLEIEINKIIKILIAENFVYNNEFGYESSEKGLICNNLQEVNCLAMTDLIKKTNFFMQYSAIDIASFLSCFTNITIDEKSKVFVYNGLNMNVKYLIDQLDEKYNHYHDLENKFEVYTGLDFTLNYDIIDEIYDWCNAADEDQCKEIIYKLQTNKNIFLGEFIKAILKINNICDELKKICILNTNFELHSKLNRISKLTLKFIATNQSLYI